MTNSRGISPVAYDISHLNPVTTKMIDGRRYVYDSFWATGKEAQSRVDRLSAWGLMARADYSRAHRMWTVWSYPHAGTAEGIAPNPVAASNPIQKIYETTVLGSPPCHKCLKYIPRGSRAIVVQWRTSVMPAPAFDYYHKACFSKDIAGGISRGNPKDRTKKRQCYLCTRPGEFLQKYKGMLLCPDCIETVRLRGANPKLETGKWPPYNVNAIARNVEQVFRSRDIRKLKKPAYNFITLHMGFIAHYSVFGFQDVYSDLEEFAQRLQTSEYSNEYDYNLKQADRHERDPDFDRWYGPAYNKSIAEAMRRIVAVARRYYPGRGTTRMFNPKTLSGAKIRYFDNEMFHPVGFTSDSAQATRMAAQCRRQGYKARMMPSVSSTGRKGWTIWESHFPAKRRY